MSVSRDFFQDCVDQEYHEKCQYESLMYEYKDAAIAKIGNHAEFVAYAYLDGIKSAKQLFDKLGLKTIHAYAIQEDLNDFIFEYDELFTQ